MSNEGTIIFTHSKIQSFFFYSLMLFSLIIHLVCLALCVMIMGVDVETALLGGVCSILMFWIVCLLTKAIRFIHHSAATQKKYGKVLEVNEEEEYLIDYRRSPDRVYMKDIVFMGKMFIVAKGRAFGYLITNINTVYYIECAGGRKKFIAFMLLKRGFTAEEKVIGIADKAGKYPYWPYPPEFKAILKQVPKDPAWRSFLRQFIPFHAGIYANEGIFK